MITFFVPGIPKPAGSKRGFPVKKGGVYTGKTVVVDTSGQKGVDWRGDVKRMAMDHRREDLLSGEVSLRIEFCLPRPKAHFRNDGSAKKGIPEYHTKRPDATKLLRAVEDALTGIIWRDDAQVVELRVSKKYSCNPGAMIGIGDMTVPTTGVNIKQEE